MTTNPEFGGIPWVGPAKAGYGNYAKRYLIWHNTSNNAPPANEGTYLRNRTDGVGWHFCGDESSFVQGCVTWQGIGEVGSSTGNHFGISFEMVGYNSSSEAHWKAVIDHAVAGLANACRKWSIPAVWLTPAQMNDGHSRGMVTHDDARRVWGHTDHDDPGPNFPRAYAASALSVALGGVPTAPVVVVGQPIPNLAEDGKMGPHTIRRLQQYMGTPQDGVISQPPGHSSVVSAVQRHLNDVIGAGLVVDGQGIRQGGPATHTQRALQRYLGTTVDGILSSPVSQAVRVLQHKLNTNAF